MMKKFKLILIFLISYNFLQIIECHSGRVLRTLYEAKEIEFNETIEYSIPPIANDFIDESRKYYELGINNNDKLNNNTRNFLKEVIKKYNNGEQNSDLFDKFEININRIDDFYVPFDDLLKSSKPANFSAMDLYFTKILYNDSEGIQNALKELESTTDRILNLMDQSKNDVKNQYCNENLVFRQQHILQIFNVILNKVYKANFLKISASKFRTRNSNGNFFGDMKQLIKVADENIQNFTTLLRSAIQNASRDIYSCYNDVDIKNETYVEITGPSQGFIFESSAVDAKKECFVNDHTDHCTMTDNSACFRHTCAAKGGILKNCETISRNYLAICQSVDQSKRYLSAESDSEIYGNISAARYCQRPLIKQKVSESYQYGGFLQDPFVIPNQFCYCNCERQNWQQGDIRAISLQWVLANFTLNEVITGLRFIEKNGMISLVPQVGKILPGGFIDQKTVHWSKIYHPEPIISNNILSYYYPHEPNNPRSNTHMVKNKEWLYVSKDLSINLDDIIVPYGHVIVGVKLNKTNSLEDENDHSLQLVVMSKKFYIGSGELSDREPHIINGTSFMLRASEILERQMINIDGKNTPLSKPKKNNEISEPFKQIKFRQTSKIDDLGQSIVPFIETRKVSSKLAMPLSKIGLYHRSYPGSGGFIAIKLESYDIYDYFEQVVDDNLYHSII